MGNTEMSRSGVFLGWILIIGCFTAAALWAFKAPLWAILAGGVGPFIATIQMGLSMMHSYKLSLKMMENSAKALQDAKESQQLLIVLRVEANSIMARYGAIQELRDIVSKQDEETTEKICGNCKYKIGDPKSPAMSCGNEISQHVWVTERMDACDLWEKENG